MQWIANNSSYEYGIIPKVYVADHTFNGSVDNYTALGGTKHIYFYRTETINIDREYKEVRLATYQTGEYHTMSNINGYNTVVKNGAYMSTATTVSYRDLGTLTQATCDSSTIYYSIIGDHTHDYGEILEGADGFYQECSGCGATQTVDAP